MSVTDQPINLSDDQVARIIDTGRAGGMYEGTPADAESARRDAATLIWHARRAYDNGNRADIVNELLSIADVDQAPAATPEATGHVSAEAFAPPVEQPAQVETPAEPAQNAEFDPEQCTDDQLKQMIAALQANAAIPAVQGEIDKLNAVLQRRENGNGQVPQEVSAPAQAPAQSPQPPPVQAGSTDAPLPPPPGGSGVAQAVPGTQFAGTSLPDAGVVAGVQAPQPVQEVQPPTQAPTQDGGRAELEAQITGQILVAYGKTFADVAQISDADLRAMIATPGGVVTESGSDPVEEESPRDLLVKQVTGPLLKAHGKGRKDLVSMEDEEIQWMLDHADGTRWPGPAIGNSPVAPAVVAQVPNMQTPPPSPPVTQTVSVPSISEFDADKMFPDVAQPPTLAFDISKLSDEELRSVHAQFHSVLCRVNWVLSHHQDGVDDVKKAIALRKASVQNELPAKTTQAAAAALVAEDSEVVRLEADLNSRMKPLRKLEVIAENSRSTCARCSREFAMRYSEEDPGRRGTS